MMLKCCAINMRLTNGIKVVMNGIENAVLFVCMHGVRAPASEGVYE